MAVADWVSGLAGTEPIAGESLEDTPRRHCQEEELAAPGKGFMGFPCMDQSLLLLLHLLLCLPARLPLFFLERVLYALKLASIL